MSSIAPVGFGNTGTGVIPSAAVLSSMDEKTRKHVTDLVQKMRFLCDDQNCRFLISPRIKNIEFDGEAFECGHIRMIIDLRERLWLGSSVRGCGDYTLDPYNHQSFTELCNFSTDYAHVGGSNLPLCAPFASFIERAGIFNYLPDEKVVATRLVQDEPNLPNSSKELQKCVEEKIEKFKQKESAKLKQEIDQMTGESQRRIANYTQMLDGALGGSANEKKLSEAKKLADLLNFDTRLRLFGGKN